MRIHIFAFVITSSVISTSAFAQLLCTTPKTHQENTRAHTQNASRLVCAMPEDAQLLATFWRSHNGALVSSNEPDAINGIQRSENTALIGSFPGCIPPTSR